jgi:hypothetical protein
MELTDKEIKELKRAIEAGPVFRFNKDIEDDKQNHRELYQVAIGQFLK